MILLTAMVVMIVSLIFFEDRRIHKQYEKLKTRGILR